MVGRIWQNFYELKILIRREEMTAQFVQKQKNEGSCRKAYISLNNNDNDKYWVYEQLIKLFIQVNVLILKYNQ